MATPGFNAEYGLYATSAQYLPSSMTGQTASAPAPRVTCVMVNGQLVCQPLIHCLPGFFWNGSRCVAPACGPGLTNCGTFPLLLDCKNLQTDSSNCGACGKVCPTGTSCQGGVCLCPSGAAPCGSSNMCCPAGSSCANGVCACSGPSSQTCGNCGTQTRTCVNGVWSAWGACTGQGCAPGSTQNCTGGKQTCGSNCKWGNCVSSCPSGETLCNGQCVNTKNNPQNCGSCGTVCKGDYTCQNGTCACPAGSAHCGTGPNCCAPGTNCTCCPGTSDICPQGGYCLYGELCGSPGQCVDPTTGVVVGDVQCSA